MNTLHHAWTVIEASAPMRAFRAHRHVLLAPAFLVMVSLMLGRATMHAPTGAVVPSADAGVSQGVAVGNGAAIVPSPDATYSVDGIVGLHEGSMLVKTEGLTTVRFAPGGSLSGWNGGFFALQDRQSLTVASVSTPVLVRVGSGTLLLPVGMQWTLPFASVPTTSGADLTAFLHGILPGPLPRSFTEEQRKVLSGLQSPSRTAVPSGGVTLAGVLSGYAATVDPEQEERAMRVAALEQAVLDGADGDALALLQAHPTLLGGVDGQRLLARLLAEENLSITLRSALIDAVTDADLQLLLAVHPARRFEGLLFFDGSVADRRALLLDLPIVDTQPEPLPELLLSRWEQELIVALEQADDRSVELTAMLTSIERGIREQRARQFVHRMAFYARAANAVFERFAATATPEQRSLLSSIMQLAKPPLPALPKAEESEAQSSSAAPLTVLQAQELEAAVRTMLVSKGGLFTKRTELRAVSPDAVHVSGVAFATPQGDELFSFTMSPQTAILSSIVRDGKTSSFPVSLEKFLEWISVQ